MFSFLKSRPFLKDLFPQGYTDIHSHLLPGIDDGAPDAASTRSLATGLTDLGISDAVTTPHVMRHVWNNSPANIRDALAEAQAVIPDGFALRAAAEYLIDDYFPELFRAGEILTLKDNMVLVEMSYMNPPMQLMEILFDLQVAGYRPILAHPERYVFYHQKFGEYQTLKNAGCSFQLNLLSVAGYYGPAVADVAEKLLKSGMIDFTGTDLHHQKHLDALSRRVLIKDVVPLVRAMENNGAFGEIIS